MENDSAYFYELVVDGVVLELLGMYALTCFAVLLMGFATTKLTLWGGMATVALWAGFGLLPGFSASEVSSTMIPAFVDLWTFYPRVVEMAVVDGYATHGAMGAFVYFAIAVFPLFPYLSGIAFGLVAWPELIILRILF